MMMLSVASCAKEDGIAEIKDQTCTIWLPIYVSPDDTMKTQTQALGNNLARQAYCR